jgi:hypothetical protein
LAGHDPAKTELRRVIDLAWVLIIEVYQEYGMKFQEATAELHAKLDDRTAPAAQAARKRPAPSAEAQSMVMLQALMGGTDFRGPKG